jgi:hypothetical protein
LDGACGEREGERACVKVIEIKINKIDWLIPERSKTDSLDR